MVAKPCKRRKSVELNMERTHGETAKETSTCHRFYEGILSAIRQCEHLTTASQLSYVLASDCPRWFID